MGKRIAKMEQTNQEEYVEILDEKGVKKELPLFTSLLNAYSKGKSIHEWLNGLDNDILSQFQIGRDALTDEQNQDLVACVTYLEGFKNKSNEVHIVVEDMLHRNSELQFMLLSIFIGKKLGVKHESRGIINKYDLKEFVEKCTCTCSDPVLFLKYHDYITKLGKLDDATT